MSRLTGAVLLIAVPVLVPAQTVERPRFEVAAIKPSPPGLQTLRFRGLGTDRFTASNVSVNELIVMAYHLYNHQVSGGPPSIMSERFDITAKAPAPANLTQMEQMVQALLADRFGLTFHREKRDRPMLDLVVGKNGPKLGEPAAGSKDRAVRGEVDAHDASMDYLASSLSYHLGITVVNKTGIQGRFSYHLKWSPDELHPRPGEAEPVSVYTAIQEQLGLKLEARKGEVELLIVDHVERPSEN